jgi:hypothetical protein
MKTLFAQNNRYVDAQNKVIFFYLRLDQKYQRLHF